MGAFTGAAAQADHPIDNADQAQAKAGEPLVLETTAGSLLHRWAGYESQPQLKGGPPVTRIYLAAVAFTYVPLAIAALLGPFPVAHQTPTLRLPFLYDWNVGFMFLVSFPSLLALTISDQHVLASALNQVQKDGLVSVSGDTAASLSGLWRKRFRLINISAQIFGIVVGILVAAFNYIAYTPERVGFWIASENRLLPAGVLFLVCIFLFYTLITIYSVRSLAISFLMTDVVAHAEIRMLPFHPDKSGGLRPVGRIGLRNQYALSVFGVNVALLGIVSFRHLNAPSSLYGLVVAAVIAYLFLGPLVFLGPLLPFRAGMLRTKTELMSEVAQRLRIELQRLRQLLPVGKITQEDEELIDRLRKLGAVIDELPVWPFDAGTLRKFLTAYVIPLLGSVGYPLVKSIFTYAIKLFQS